MTRQLPPGPRQLPARNCISHAIASVRNNIAYAFRISWPWYAFLVPIRIAADFLADYVTGGSPEANPEPALPIYLVLGVINLLAFSSIAVNWHRYILLDEVPQGSEIFRLDSKTWRYFGNVLLLVIIVTVATTLIMVPLFLLVSLSGSIVLIGFSAMIAALLSGVLFFRLGVKLPSIALDRPDFLFRDSWKATQGNNVPLFLIFLFEFAVLIAALLVLILLQFIMAPISPILAVTVSAVLQLVLGWILSIFGITILTSLYGFFVELRDF